MQSVFSNSCFRSILIPLDPVAGLLSVIVVPGSFSCTIFIPPGPFAVGTTSNKCAPSLQLTVGVPPGKETFSLATDIRCCLGGSPVFTEIAPFTNLV